MKASKIKRTAEKGITLVALVITIVILIILATVTINKAFGEGGLIQRAQQTKVLTEQAILEEQKGLNSLMGEYANIMSEEPEVPSEVEIAKNNGEPFDKKTTIEDDHGNKITVPEGFKIAGDSGNTVQQGIVIEDAFSTNANVRGSQYVWIPVGKFIKDDGKESNEIVLGRYTFAEDAKGTPTLKQAAYTTDAPENYKNTVVIDSYYSELSTYRVGKDEIFGSHIDPENATAYNLEAWVNSIKANGGYYIGRYEASYASGSSTADYRAASKVAINTYKDSNNGVKSDLINSYAWDTAIVYIQEAGNTNYANKTSVNSSLANTGKNKDEVCKINDMSSNCEEWTTEYSSHASSHFAYPCVIRGGLYDRSYDYLAYRVGYTPTSTTVLSASACI